MHIDLLTFGAQCLNFVILMALLKHFLYVPTLAAVAAREQSFSTRESDLEARTARVAADEARLSQALQDLEARRTARLEAIEREMQTRQNQLLEAAQQTAAAELQRRRIEWQQTEAQRMEELRASAAMKLRHALHDAILALTDVPLEEAMVRAFLRRLRELSPAELERLRHGAVVTALPLTADLQRQIIDAVGPLTFSTASGEAGIRITTDTWTLSWSVDGYLR